MNILDGLTREKQKIVEEALKVYTAADDDVKQAIALGTSWAERHIGKVFLLATAGGWLIGFVCGVAL